MKKRIKQVLPSLASREDAEAAMHELALTVNNQRQLVGRRDAYVLEVTQRYAADLADCEEAIKEKTDALRAWAEANPDQFPKGRKSLQLAAGTLGFRTGTPKLALVSRAWTWEKVLDAIGRVEGWMGFVRSKFEVDKEAILGGVNEEPELAEKIKKVGLKITQDESFFVEPDLTPFEARQTVATD